MKLTLSVIETGMFPIEVPDDAIVVGVQPAPQQCGWTESLGVMDWTKNFLTWQILVLEKVKEEGENEIYGVL